MFLTFNGETPSYSFSATKWNELLLVADAGYVSMTIHYASTDATIDYNYDDTSENIIWEWQHGALVPHIRWISVKIITTSMAPWRF